MRQIRQYIQKPVKIGENVEIFENIAITYIYFI